MKVDRKELRIAPLSFHIEIIELILPNLQKIPWRPRRTVRRVIMASRHIVWDNDDLTALGREGIRNLIIEWVGPPGVAKLGHEIEGVVRKAMTG